MGVLLTIILATATAAEPDSRSLVSYSVVEEAAVLRVDEQLVLVTKDALGDSRFLLDGISAERLIIYETTTAGRVRLQFRTDGELPIGPDVRVFTAPPEMIERSKEP